MYLRPQSRWLTCSCSFHYHSLSNNISASLEVSIYLQTLKTLSDSLAVVVSTIILSVTISLHHSKYLYIYKLSRHSQGKSHCSWMSSQSNAYSTSATWLLIFVWCRCTTNTANNLTACSRTCKTSSADVLANHANNTLGHCMSLLHDPNNTTLMLTTC